MKQIPFCIVELWSIEFVITEVEEGGSGTHKVYDGTRRSHAAHLHKNHHNFAMVGPVNMFLVLK